MNTEEKKEEPLFEPIEWVGSTKERLQAKMKHPKTERKQKPLSGTMFKIWCWSYEAVKGDSMPIKQKDIHKHTGISIPSIHHIWNEANKTTDAHILAIVRGLPYLVKDLIDKKYYYLPEAEREAMLKKAPMLTYEQLERQLQKVIEF